MQKPRLRSGHKATAESCEGPRIRYGNRASMDHQTAFADGRIVYVHGAGPQLPASELKPAWDRELFDVNAGDRTRIAYWAKELAASSASVEEPVGVVKKRLDSLFKKMEKYESAEEMRRFSQAMMQRIDECDEPITGSYLQSRLMHLLYDLWSYVSDPRREERIGNAIADRLTHNGPLVIIAFGAGALATIDVLRKAQSQPNPPNVSALITVSSPFDLLREHSQTASQRLARPGCVREWIDLADEADEFASLPNAEVPNGPERKRWRHEHADSPHPRFSPLWYLGCDDVRQIVREQVGTEFAQAATNFHVAKDVVGMIEDYPTRRHGVLIQLKDLDGGPLDTNRRQIHEVLLTLLGDQFEQGEVEFLRRFVSARLTRREIEQLSERFEQLNISRIWKDSVKASLIWRSVHTVQAHTAKVGYRAGGQRLSWAVLDTGVRGDHPHFLEHKNVVRQWDCTQIAKSRRMCLAKPTDILSPEDGDLNGHGTHVAAIIAGESPSPMEIDRRGVDDSKLFGMAPQCQIHSYKVLNNQGRGRDSWIIKALDHIASVNDSAGDLVIHGVNLSLGGPFDASVYGCGHSPVCMELRRLWRQGVLVVIAVGNQGMAEIKTSQGVMRSNQDVSVIDPANLEEAIAVGSVHKSRPHTYGVSFFSSRGPTADGRNKPDLVAPGEKILSARSDFRAAESKKASDLYVERSGTSMAAPHVSGVLASFLSVRREFIGRPDEVKSILLDNCTCLGRDHYFQGRGMPNLLQMLANS